MYSLTSSQQNIWNLQKYYERTTISAICGAIYFKDEIDTEILKKAINHVIEHQSGLRLRFREANGKAMQQVTEYQYEEIPVLQFSDKDALRQYVLQCSQKLTSLTDIPLYHFAIFQLNGQTGIVTALSHLVSDAWTLSLIAKQISDAYWELAQDTPCDSKTWDYLDHIYAEEEYLASSRYEKDTNYWQEKYPDKPEPTSIKLCTATTTAITARRVISILDSELTERIGQFCKETSITPAVLFETAVILYLAKINPENQNVTIGTPVLGRHNAREKNAAGMFISTMPLTILVSASDTVEALANRITDSHRELFRHQRYPYSDILRQLREKHDFTGNLYDVMVSYQNAQTGVNAETEWFSNGYSETPFVLHIDNRDNGNSYTWTIDYQTEVFRQEAEIRLIIGRLEHILRQILINYKIPVGEISIIPDAEYRQTIFDFNDTATDYPRDKCVHTLFEEQVERMPDKTAVIACDKTLTYTELNEQANRIAHSLIGMGIGVGDIVAFALQRQSYLIAAMFGILKAGAAYLPVDLDYPQDRIEYMLQDSQAKYFITEDTILNLLEQTHADNPAVIMSSKNPCYCIYTSGTTGKPKGVIISHCNVANFVQSNAANIFQTSILNDCEYFIAANSVSFDIILHEIHLPLLNGHRTILLSNEQMHNIGKSVHLFQGKSCGLSITPTKLGIYMTDQSFCNSLQNMSSIMCRGDIFAATAAADAEIHKCNHF